MADQPVLFIASSQEGLQVAEAVNIKLEQDFRVKQWDNAFNLSSMTLPSLLSRADEAEFAVFVFHADDRATIRGTEYSIVRDNVVFELGLFIGALGVEKCFVLVPKSIESDFRLPTDLAGLTVSAYDDALDDMVDAVATSCARIKQAVKKSQAAATSATQPSTSAQGQVSISSDHLRSLQSELWRARIDLERAVQDQAKLLTVVTSHFHSVAKPATDKEIAAWEDGAQSNYATPPKIHRHMVYFVERDVVLPPLYGAGALSVIVAPGVNVLGMDQWSHNSVYFMDGFRKSG